MNSEYQTPRPPPPIQILLESLPMILRLMSLLYIEAIDNKIGIRPFLSKVWISCDDALLNNAHI